MTMTASEVRTAVRRHFGADQDNLGPEWAALEEFTLAPGGGGRADLLLVRAWSGQPKGHERVLIEIKVSRSDLRHELARPEKIAPFAAVVHRVYFAAPAGLVRESDDLGAGVGLLEVTPAGAVRVVRRAVRRRAPQDLPQSAFVESFRRAARSEARIRTAGHEDPTARIVALEAELVVSRRAETTASARAREATTALRQWLQQLADAGGAPCMCGLQLQPKASRWASAQHTDGTPCPKWGEVDVVALGALLCLGPSTP